MKIPTLALVVALFVAACGDSSLTISNQSSFVLNEVRLADVGDVDWGPNLLTAPLLPGSDVLVNNIDCGNYDVLVVANTGVSCTLQDLNLCFEDVAWPITNSLLATCAF